MEDVDVTGPTGYHGDDVQDIFIYQSLSGPSLLCWCVNKSADEAE